MKITVQFSVDDVGTVDARELGRLIAKREILAFERSSGWVKIGVDPVRGDGGEPYDGPERRNIIQKKAHETVIACQYCALTAKGEWSVTGVLGARSIEVTH
jgi:hypothetical protein